MAELWKNVVGPDQHHASVMFWEGPKLDVEGFRWALATFMDALRPSAQQNWRRLDRCVLDRSDDGQHVQLSFIVCQRAPKSSQGLCYLRVQSHLGWVFDPLYFVLDTEAWDELEKRQKGSDGLMVLLPWVWEENETS